MIVYKKMRQKMIKDRESKKLNMINGVNFVRKR